MNGHGFKKGFDNPVAMAYRYGFISAKTYNDSKHVLMMMSTFLLYKFYTNHDVAFTIITSRLGT